MRRIPQRARAGFTLLELMVVLLIIGVITAMILPEMRGTLEDSLLRTSSRQLIQVMSLASSRAISSRETHRLRLESKTGRYHLERQVSPGSGPDAFKPLGNVPGGEGQLHAHIRAELRKTGSTEPAWRWSREGDPAEHRDSLFFYPDGTAEAAEIRLRDQEGFELSLRINPVTARVDLVEKEKK